MGRTSPHRVFGLLARLLPGLLLFVLLLCVSIARANVFLHFPRGSNNRLNEPTLDVQNPHRLFRSEAPPVGGYGVGDNCQPVCSDGRGNYNAFALGAGEGIPYFYTGSTVPIEWSILQGSATPYARATIVLQYVCDDNPYGMASVIRDGRIWDTAPLNSTAETDPRYGLHETRSYYEECAQRQRNMNLFLGSMVLNGSTAVFTRQNSRGERFGFECSEERDYYPYWHPSPWRDIAVLTDEPERCPFFQAESQNVRNKGHCSLVSFNSMPSCTAAGGRWLEDCAFRTPPPVCEPCPYSPVNMMGGPAASPSTLFNWTVPDVVLGSREEAVCVLRIRYNLTSMDFNGWTVDSTNNGIRAPFPNTPADFVGLGTNISGPLRLALRSEAMGCVFEDRSHAFRIRRRPANIAPTARIHNIGVHGKRGPAEVVSPALPYGFVPPVVHAMVGDYVHFQWTGADSNPLALTGNGRPMTDRTNLVQIADLGTSVPLPAPEHTLFRPANGAVAASLVARFAFLNQSQCNASATDPSDLQNCAVLNAAPAYFDGGLWRLTTPGAFAYMSTRNNEFGSVLQKGLLVVQYDWQTAAAAAGGALAGMLLLLFIALLMIRSHAEAHPEGRLSRTALARSLVRIGRSKDDLAEEGELEPLRAASSQPSSNRRQVDGEDQIGPRSKSVVVFLLLYFLATAAVWVYGFLSNYYDHPLYFAMAKGAGHALNFNCALILLPVMRNLTSWLHATPLARLLPLDSAVTFHRLVGGMIIALSSWHIVWHYIDFLYFERTLALPLRIQILQFVPLTGHIIAFCMLVMLLGAVGVVRKAGILCGRCGGFDVFWWTHRLYVPALGLLLVHSPRYWMWAFLVLGLFAVDQIIRCLRGGARVELLRVVLEEGDVMRLEFKRRHGFTYRPGQYIYLNCPQVSTHEWHAFTLTSAPEQRILTVHIRCRGDWTRRLRDFLAPRGVTVDYGAMARAVLRAQRGGVIGAPNVAEAGPAATARPTSDVATPTVSAAAAVAAASVAAAEETSEPVSGLAVTQDTVGGGASMSLTVAEQAALSSAIGVLWRRAHLRLDGPYGTAAEHVFDRRVVMLVATGIGITPFASVIRSIAYRRRTSMCPHCRASTPEGEAPGGKEPAAPLPLSTAGIDLVTPPSPGPASPVLPLPPAQATAPSDHDDAEEACGLLPTRVHVFWLCRSPNELTWFASLLRGVTDDPRLRGVFEISTFVTGEVELGSASPPPLAATHAGRPNWARVFRMMRSRYPREKIGVFYCGPPELASELRQQCVSNSRGTARFVFSKEVF